jgi:hypothetical protein
MVFLGNSHPSFKRRDGCIRLYIQMGFFAILQITGKGGEFGVNAGKLALKKDDNNFWVWRYSDSLDTGNYTRQVVNSKSVKKGATRHMARSECWTQIP